MFCDVTRTVKDNTRPAPELHSLPAEQPWTLPHMEQAPARPGLGDLQEELARAETELGNAIYMHRNAWVKARQRRDELAWEVKGRHPGPDTERVRAAELAALCETDTHYSRRLGDVKFWCGERAALAASVSALVAMIQARPRPRTPTQREGR